MAFQSGERLKEKLLEFYIEERKNNREPVKAKYNATHYLVMFVFGMIEHYAEWEDMEKIKEILQYYRNLELYVFENESTEYLESMYQESEKSAKLG
jgi:hypothetical protein